MYGVGPAMKRKIIVGLGVFAFFGLLGSVYIASAIGAATADLDKLIALHQVESLREKHQVENLREALLSQIKKVQSDLQAKEPRGAAYAGMVAGDLRNMKGLVDGCFGCHHSEPVSTALGALRAETNRYAAEVSRSLEARAREAPAPDEALRIGAELIGQVRDMIDAAATGLGKQTRRTLEAIRHTKFVVYALVALCPALAVVLGYVFISGLTRPLHVLLESTRKLEGGDLDHRVAELPDEFRELALSFNDMARSLKEQMHKVQRTEQMAVVGQLAAGLAHEIKNPLGGIKAAMQVLSQEADLSRDDRDVVERVSREVVRLEALMRNFLNFAKPAKPQLCELNVNELINMILAFYAKSLSDAPGRATPVTIEKELAPVPATMADPVQLQQVLLNLLLNAADSMPNGGTLGVRTFYENGSIHIEIADTGRGVSTELVDKIFLPFFTTKPKGTGLGLAISKQLVEQHGGAITLAAKPAGGTVFRVRLPRLAPAPVAA